MNSPAENRSLRSVTMNQATPPAPDDHALVAAAQSGDRSSLDQLLRRHYDRIYAVCRRVTGNETDAADAAQEAMISIVRSLPKFDGRSSFGTWVYRIATNASLDELRRRRRRPVPAAERTDDGAPVEHADPDAGVRIESVVDGMVLDQALADLADDFRVPVVLRDVGGLDYAEIAAGDRRADRHRQEPHRPRPGDPHRPAREPQRHPPASNG